ncbi:glycosyltransferase family 2 protein [Nigerium massiliense]|uniref:glycosyltransferase family 2 protein n=1 Tax=Nigerium massiliense TaxID=1522317 RepID=UPI00058C1FFB|nr:galactosyltransferase-related protein [Nigerium massiliense]
MITALVTIVRGRHAHLGGMLRGSRRATRRPDVVSVCAMDDPAIEGIVRSVWPDAVCTSVACDPARLPLSAARNAAAKAAIYAGAEMLVFLDVDCIPSPGLFARYDQVLSEADAVPTIAAGEVAYLPPTPNGYPADGLDGLADPHPERPILAPGETRRATDFRLFWSLSFAMRAQDWVRSGGFDERYTGYGAEDTDFGARVEAAGGQLLWVGGARAFHQYHDNPMPPVHHLDDIVRNARLFHATWGWWPMEGWLREFDALGLVCFDGRDLRS